MGAGLMLVGESVLPQQLRAQIQTHDIQDISDADNNPLKTVGNIAIVVRLAQLVVKLDFIVRKSLAAPVILDFLTIASSL